MPPPQRFGHFLVPQVRDHHEDQPAFQGLPLDQHVRVGHWRVRGAEPWGRPLPSKSPTLCHFNRLVEFLQRTLALDQTGFDVHLSHLRVSRPFFSLDGRGPVQLKGHGGALRPCSSDVQNLPKMGLVDHRVRKVEEAQAGHDPCAMLHHTHQGSCKGWQVDVGDVVLV